MTVGWQSIGKAESAILAQLSSYLDAKSPRLASFLTRMWNDQQNAVTYRELREAIHDGELSMEYLLEWQQDYSRFIETAYKPIMEATVRSAAQELIAQYGSGFADPQMTAIERFIDTRGGNLIREISTSQHRAINVLVKQASMSSTMTVDQLARAIRPCIGLTERQTATTYRYYERMRERYFKQLRDAGKSEKAAATEAHKRALQRQATYSERMHRRRAASIAQTEMAYAYNNGTDEIVRENIQIGYFGKTTKRWLTALDERVCEDCGKMENETVDMDARFSNGKVIPPAHPNCRCAVYYDVQAPSKAARKWS